MNQSPKAKRYPLQDSPFYKLKGKGQLARLLRVDVSDLDELAATSSYRVWVEDGREIQAPKNKLAAVHKRMAILLKRIQLPGYVYSTKGRSHIDNAAQHCGAVPMVKTDISKFYPSTTREMVLRLFQEDFCCAGDLAHLMADVCCFEGKHLPTGSPISGYVAFLAARPIFDKVESMATDAGCVMSTFVDDVALSGRSASMPLLLRVRRELRRGGFKTSNRKSRVYKAGQPKKLTGTIVTKDGLLLPNRQHEKIRATKQLLAKAATPEQRRILAARLRGQLEAANQVLKHPRAAQPIL